MSTEPNLPAKQLVRYVAILMLVGGVLSFYHRSEIKQEFGVQ